MVHLGDDICHRATRLPSIGLEAEQGLSSASMARRRFIVYFPILYGQTDVCQTISSSSFQGNRKIKLKTGAGNRLDEGLDEGLGYQGEERRDEEKKESILVWPF